MLKKGTLFCFALGAVGYPCLEMLWRGRTHAAMALAGGAGLCAIQKINRVFKKRPLPVRAGMGALAITGIELLSGLVFNRSHRIWDYRRFKYHYRGHICPRYTALWFVLCMGLCPFFTFPRRFRP